MNAKISIINSTVTIREYDNHAENARDELLRTGWSDSERLYQIDQNYCKSEEVN